MDNKSYIFISHASENKALANSLCESLEKEGLICWIAPRNLRFGANYPDAIMEGISNSAVMIVLVSEYSNNSDHVQNEITRAAHRKIELIPIRIDNSKLSNSMEYFLSTKQWVDIRKNQLSANDRKELIDTCKHYLNINKNSASQIGDSNIVTNTQQVTARPRFIHRNLLIALFSLIGIVSVFFTSKLIFNTEKKTNENTSQSKLPFIKQEVIDEPLSKIPTKRNEESLSKGKSLESNTSPEKNQQIIDAKKFLNDRTEDNREANSRINTELKSESKLNKRNDLLNTPTEVEAPQPAIQSKSSALEGKFENYKTNEFLEFIPNGKKTIYTGELSNYKVSGSVIKTNQNSFQLTGDASGQFYIKGNEIKGRAKTKESGVDEFRSFTLVNYQ